MTKQTSIPSLEEMLDAGVHYGHQTRRWNPKMKQFIFDAREGVHIIDLERTHEQLAKAVSTIEDRVHSDTAVVIVGTKRQAAPVVEQIAKEYGLFYITNRWPGGLVTNFHNVRNAITKYEELFVLGNNEKELNKLSTKNKYMVFKERDRIGKVVGGLAGLDKAPEVLIVIDPRKEQTALLEARKAGLLTIGIVDTNTDPQLVDFAIPANDDALRSIELILGALSKAVQQAKHKKALKV